MLKLVFFLIAALANANIDQEKFKDDYIEDQSASSFIPSKNPVDFQTIFKIISFTTFSDDYTTVSKNKLDTSENDIYGNNKGLEGYFSFTEQVESVFNFNFHDKVVFQVPLKISNSHSMSSDAIKQQTTPSKLARRVKVDLGMLLNFNIFDWFKLGIRGGIDDKDGYLFTLNNRVYVEEGKDGHSFDSFAMQGLFFAKFPVNITKWFELEPEVRVAYGAKQAIVSKNSLLERSVAAYTFLLPAKFEFQFLEELKLRFQVLPQGSVSEKYNIGGKAKLELEYSLMEFATITIPLILSSDSDFLKMDDFANTKLEISIIPEIGVDFKLFKQLYLIAQVDLEYKYQIISSEINGPIRLNWNCGIRFNS